MLIRFHYKFSFVHRHHTRKLLLILAHWVWIVARLQTPNEEFMFTFSFQTLGGIFHDIVPSSCAVAQSWELFLLRSCFFSLLNFDKQTLFNRSHTQNFNAFRKLPISFRRRSVQLLSRLWANLRLLFDRETILRLLLFADFSFVLLEYSLAFLTFDMNFDTFKNRKLNTIHSHWDSLCVGDTNPHICLRTFYELLGTKTNAQRKIFRINYPNNRYTKWNWKIPCHQILFKAATKTTLFCLIFFRQCADTRCSYFEALTDYVQSAYY